jgi:PAS domain S-box-containing protein
MYPASLPGSNGHNDVASKEEDAPPSSIAEFDDLIPLAALIYDASHASLLLTEAEWTKFESPAGPFITKGSPDDLFFALAVAGKELLLVPNALDDARFAANDASSPLFYAGLPLIGTDGKTLGVLGVWDAQPQKSSERQNDGLQKLGRRVVALLEARLLPLPVSGMADKGTLTSEIRYRRLFEAARDGILILDFETGAITDVNPYILERLGYGREEIVGQQLWQIGRPKDTAASQEAFRELLEKSVVRYENLPLLSKTGQLLEVEVVANVYLEANEPVIQCNIRDITDRKRAAGVDREFQNFLISTLNVLASQIAALGANGNLDAGGKENEKDTDISRNWRAIFEKKGEETYSNGVGELALNGMSQWSKEANQVVQGIREVMARRRETQDLGGGETETHLIEQRWFNAFVTYFMDAELMRIVTSHQDLAERQHAEKQIRFQANLLDTVGEAVVATDLENKVIYWNRFAEQLYGWTSHEALSRDIATLVIPESSLVTAREIRDKVMSGESWSGDIELQHRSGTRFSGLVTNTPIYEDGKLVGIISISKDITERKTAEALLYDSEERNRLLIDSVQDYAIFLLDPQGYVTTWNSGAQRLKGYRADEIIGKHFSNFYPEVDLAAGKPEMELEVAKAEGQFKEEGWRLRKDGTRFWANVLITAVRDEKGVLRGFSKVTQDITQRKVDKDELERTNREILTIWESMTDAFVAVDLNWNITYANEHTANLWQRERKNLLGKNLWDAFPEATNLSFHYEYKKALNEQKPVVFEEFYPPLSLWFEVHAYPSSFGLSIYFRDISERKAAEQAIRLSELRFQGIVANAPGMVYQFIVYPDNSMEIPFVNDGCRRLFALPPNEIQNTDNFFRNMLHPADLPSWESSLEISASELSPWDWEGRIKLPSGKVKWVQGAARPKRLLNGATLWDGLLMEITDRKEAEEERDRFFTLSLDMLCISDRNGTFKRLNPAFETTLGYSLSELIGKSILDFVHPDDQADTAAEFAKVAQGDTTSQFVNRYRCHDGSYKWLSWQTVPYEDLAYAVAHDITPLKEAEAKLRKANDELEVRVTRRTEQLARSNRELEAEFLERQRAVEAQQESYSVLQAVIEGSTDFIFVKDLEGRYLMINTAGANYYNASPEQIIGKSDDDFLSPETAQFVLQSELDVVAEQTTRTFEETTERNGERRTFLVTKGVHRNQQGQVIGTIGIARDITNLKRQADALQLAKEEADIANQAKSEFLSRMSHELRTPLNAILGFGQILEMRPLEAEESAGVTQILKAGWHLLDLVNEILDIARVEAGHIELSLEAIDPSDLIPECCELLRPLADQRMIQMLQEKVEAGKFHVLADRQRFKQVLLNLLSNAIKYNFDGGQVQISFESFGEESIRISVRDTGFGLSKQDMARLFTPFERLNAANTKIEGSGLGLALSQRLLAAMDGTLGVESVQGEGSTFWIDLPRTEASFVSLTGHQVSDFSGVQQFDAEFGEDDPDARLVEKMLGARSPVLLEDSKLTGMGPESIPDIGMQLRILVVEDNQVNQQIILYQLKNLGHEVIVLDNGFDAIEKWQQVPIDLILMDCNMPRMNGYAAAREIRRREAPDRHIPIIALTANAMNGDREKCLAAGMDDYLSKPTKQGTLEKVISRWMPLTGLRNEIVDTPKKKEEPNAVLQRERWSELQNEIDPSLLVDLCELFIVETPQLLQTLQASLQAGNAKAVGQDAHKIKGSCATMGAMRMAAACREIEAQVESGHIVECFPILERLQGEYIAVEKALQSYLADPLEHNN